MKSPFEFTEAAMKIAFTGMTTKELKAYQRVLKMSGACLTPDPRDTELNATHSRLVAEVLATR